MATKNYLSSKDKKEGIFVNDKSNGQYRNLSLHQNYQDSSGYLASTNSISNKKDSNQDFIESFNEKPKNDEWNKSGKSSSSNCLKDFIEKAESEKEKVKVESNLKASNSSTLSLHISAYENSVESGDTLDASVDGGEYGLKKKELGLIKKWKNVKQIFDGSSSSLFENSFEFPRQQEDAERTTEPEIAQFKASQRLFNPNESSNQQQQIQQQNGYGIGNQFLYPPPPTTVIYNGPIYVFPQNYIPASSFPYQYSQHPWAAAAAYSSSVSSIPSMPSQGITTDSTSTTLTSSFLLPPLPPQIFSSIPPPPQPPMLPQFSSLIPPPPLPPNLKGIKSTADKFGVKNKIGKNFQKNKERRRRHGVKKAYEEHGNANFWDKADKQFELDKAMKMLQDTKKNRKTATSLMPSSKTGGGGELIVKAVNRLGKKFEGLEINKK